jgi:hypothetical protein
VLFEILQEDVGPRRLRQAKRAVKRKQSKYAAKRPSDKSRTIPQARVVVLR